MVENQDIFNCIDKCLSGGLNRGLMHTQKNVVMPVLELLGYEGSELRELYREDKKSIVLTTEDNSLSILINNVKSIISIQDIEKAISSLSENTTWVIITNGERYILINNDIKIKDIEGATLRDRVVFDEVKRKKTGEKAFIKYMSRENIFTNRTTMYFVNIAQFKAIKYPGKDSASWLQYQSTLRSFADYLIRLYGEYRGLNNIDFSMTKDFWKTKVLHTTENLSLRTCQKDVRYITSMVKTLDKYSYIKNSNFQHSIDEEVKKLYLETVPIKDQKPFELNEKLVKKALSELGTRKNSNRNKAIFLLNLYCGLSINEIVALKWRNLEDNKYLKLNNRRLYLPYKIQQYILALKEENIKINSEYIFVGYYEGKYNAINSTTIGRIYRDISKNAQWDDCCPENITTELIRKLFDSGYAIEEISYLTGKRIDALSTYITEDMIMNNVDLSRDHAKRVHPFQQVLN